MRADKTKKNCVSKENFPVCKSGLKNREEQSQEISAQTNFADGRTNEQVSPDINRNKYSSLKKPCVVTVGDSMIKHVDPNKLAKKRVYKYTWRDS